MSFIKRIRIWLMPLSNIASAIAKFAELIGNAIFRGIVIGIILNVVAAYFYPELPERIPVIFGFYDGFMQFGEFAVKYALGFVNAFFNGNAIEFYGEINTQFQAMWIQFLNWLSTIHF